MANPSRGHKSCFTARDDGDATFDETYEYTSETLDAVTEHLISEGIRCGSREQREERAVEGSILVGGTVTMMPTSAELDAWMPRILGSAKDGFDNFLITGGELPTFDAQIDKVGDVHEYSDGVVAQATLSAEQGAILELSMDMLFKTRNTGATLGVAALVDAQPLVYHEGAFTFAGSSREINSFNMVINNNSLDDILRFSQTRTHIPTGVAEVEFSPVMPFTADEVAVLSNGITGAAATLVFTKGGDVWTFTFANLKFSGAGPQVTSRDDEILYQPTGKAYETSAGNDTLIVNHP